MTSFLTRLSVVLPPLHDLFPCFSLDCHSKRIVSSRPTLHLPLYPYSPLRMSNLSPPTRDRTYLTVGNPDLASEDLFYALRGTYQIIRKPLAPNGTNHPHKNTQGLSAIWLRLANDSIYALELIQKMTFIHHPDPGKLATTSSKRAFRLENGRWSVWDSRDGAATEPPTVITRKTADLNLCEVPMPKYRDGYARGVFQRVKLESMRYDGEEADEMTLVAWLGPRPMLQIFWKELGGLEYVDELWPIKDCGLVV